MKFYYKAFPFFLGIFIGSLILFFLPGCMMTSADKVKLNPNSTPYVVQFDNVDEMIIKSAKVPSRDKDGSIVRDKDGNVIMEAPEKEICTYDSDGKILSRTKERQLASQKIKDQTMKTPLNAYDLGSQLLSNIPFLSMGYGMYKLGENGIKSAAKDPLVFEKTNSNPIIIGEDGIIYPPQE